MRPLGAIVDLISGRATIFLPFLLVLLSCSSVQTTPTQKPDSAAEAASSAPQRGQLVAADDNETAEGERLEQEAQRYSQSLEEMFTSSELKEELKEEL